ncbi:cobalamin B12-binding domain-containing protein [Nocardioides sp. cx-169]|uniref:cobalamin B12-binding domain-containing protein n=1 Tax=Nocardioides sp. cx-169 TaxID=2899080 RepID=UPI001E39C1A2|nr:cobalamin B12-binding domain-containing protein [Nocardioides sp. cx-169]MCD4536486.1 cobalamin B12-binding domain-containing protein [Nocardioides sp. cx-169]
MSRRVLVAKPGLDGHDRGAKVVALALRDAGFEVVYTGIRQRPRDIARIAMQEDVALVGLSILSGAHVSLSKAVLDELNALGAADIKVIVGGTVPGRDIAQLTALGISGVFPTGTSLNDVVAGVDTLLPRGSGAPDPHRVAT